MEKLAFLEILFSIIHLLFLRKGSSLEHVHSTYHNHLNLVQHIHAGVIRNPTPLSCGVTTVLRALTYYFGRTFECILKASFWSNAVILSLSFFWCNVKNAHCLPPRHDWSPCWIQSSFSTTVTMLAQKKKSSLCLHCLPLLVHGPNKSGVAPYVCVWDCSIDRYSSMVSFTWNYFSTVITFVHF